MKAEFVDRTLRNDFDWIDIAANGNVKLDAALRYTESKRPDLDPESILSVVFCIDMTCYRDLGHSLTDTTWMKEQDGVLTAMLLEVFPDARYKCDLNRTSEDDRVR